MDFHQLLFLMWLSRLLLDINNLKGIGFRLHKEHTFYIPTSYFSKVKLASRKTSCLFLRFENNQFQKDFVLMLNISLRLCR